MGVGFLIFSGTVGGVDSSCTLALLFDAAASTSNVSIEFGDVDPTARVFADVLALEELDLLLLFLCRWRGSMRVVSK